MVHHIQSVKATLHSLGTIRRYCFPNQKSLLREDTKAFLDKDGGVGALLKYTFSEMSKFKILTLKDIS